MIAVWITIAFAAVGVNTALKWVRGGLQRFGAKRLKKQVDRVGPGFIGKIVRHAPTGTVGFCIGVGHGPIKPWRWSAPIMVQFVPCPECACAVRDGGMMGVMIARAAGHVSYRPIREVVSALASEAAAFSAAMQKGAE